MDERDRGVADRSVTHEKVEVVGEGVEMGRNVTVNLDEEVLRRARVVAPRRGVSLSRLLRDELRRLADESDAYRAARESARRRLLRGAMLGGGPYPTREILHDRAALR